VDYDAAAQEEAEAEAPEEPGTPESAKSLAHGVDSVHGLLAQRINARK
jgi:hypothetical protein